MSKRGRPLGDRLLTYEQIAKILVYTLTKKYSRREVAAKSGTSMFSVWKYRQMYLKR